MAFTTARTAGKPATLLLPILVSTDSKHIEIKLDADPRFAAAAAGGARYLGEASGLTPDAAMKLQIAILFACEETFGHLDIRHSQVEVTLNQFPDRIEVTIIHHSGGHSAEPHPLLNAGANPLEGVDRVQYEKQADSNVTRLTKFLGPHA